jgi:SNF2 family DNA or RNA helicase
MARFYRLGQKNETHVYRLVTKGTLEQSMLRLQNFKTKVAKAVVDKTVAVGYARACATYLACYVMHSCCCVQ